MTGSENSNARIRIGEFYCRSVRFEVADEFAYAMNCHCSNCRRTTGAAFKPFAGITQDKLRIIQGGDQRMTFGDDTTHNGIVPGAARCSIPGCARDNGCMSPGEPWSIPPSIRPSGPIFVGSKAPWHEITDDLPQYRENIGDV